MKPRIDLTYVYPGTYQAIAEKLHYSAETVRKVAYGKKHNVFIEHELLIAVRRRKADEREMDRLRTVIRRARKRYDK